MLNILFLLKLFIFGVYFQFRDGVHKAVLLGLNVVLVNFVVLPMSFSQGHPRTETPLPSSVSLYSDRVPNTSNQMFGSGLYTDLGKEMIRLDNLLILTANHRKAKRNPEMQPCWGLTGTGCVQITLLCIVLFSWDISFWARLAFIYIQSQECSVGNGLFFGCIFFSLDSPNPRWQSVCVSLLYVLAVYWEFCFYIRFCVDINTHLSEYCMQVEAVKMSLFLENTICIFIF